MIQHIIQTVGAFWMGELSILSAGFTYSTVLTRPT